MMMRSPASLYHFPFFIWNPPHTSWDRQNPNMKEETVHDQLNHLLSPYVSIYASTCQQHLQEYRKWPAVYKPNQIGTCPVLAKSTVQAPTHTNRHAAARTHDYLWVCMYARKHICACTHACTHTGTHAHTRRHAHSYPYVHARARLHAHTHMHAHTPARTLTPPTTHTPTYPHRWIPRLHKHISERCPHQN
jgi:hypothetical protein